ncbi:MAG: sulfur-oxidizing protein SoxY [Candidatus Azotimanducaceae bacterium]|jgi:sulfur-oxidizing protein SoxY
MQRRALISYAAGGLLIGLLPLDLSAAAKLTLATVYGDAEFNTGRVHLQLPALAENGSSVPLTISVDSPMTEADHVSEIRLFADKNPVPQLARYRLFAASGKASISTRVRLSDSQVITAVARMNDNSLWVARGEIVVTLAACIEPLL